MSLPGIRSRDVYFNIHRLLSNSSINATRTSKIKQFFDKGLFKSLGNNSTPTGKIEDKEQYDSIVNKNVRKTLETLFKSGNRITLLGKKYVIADFYWKDNDFKQEIKRPTFEKKIYNVTPQMEQRRAHDLPEHLKYGTSSVRTNETAPVTIFRDSTGKIHEIDAGQRDSRVPKSKEHIITVAAENQDLYIDMMNLKELDINKLDDLDYVRKKLSMPLATTDYIKTQMGRYKDFLESNNGTKKLDNLISYRQQREKQIESLLSGKEIDELEIRKYDLNHLFEKDNETRNTNIRNILDMLEGKTESILNDDELFNKTKNNAKNEDDVYYDDDVYYEEDENEPVNSEFLTNVRGGGSRDLNKDRKEWERNRDSFFRNFTSRNNFKRQGRGSSHGRVQSIDTSDFSIYITVELYLQEGNVLTKKSMGKFSCDRSWNEISRNFGILMGQESRHYMLPIYNEYNESIKKNPTSRQFEEDKYYRTKKKNDLYGRERVNQSSRNFVPRRGGNKFSRKNKTIKNKNTRKIIINTNKKKTYKLTN